MKIPQQHIDISLVDCLHFLHPFKKFLLKFLHIRLWLFIALVRSKEWNTATDFFHEVDINPVEILSHHHLILRVLFNLELLHFNGAILIGKTCHILIVNCCQFSNYASSQLPLLQSQSRVFACREKQLLQTIEYDA